MKQFLFIFDFNDVICALKIYIPHISNEETRRNVVINHRGDIPCTVSAGSVRYPRPVLGGSTAGKVNTGHRCIVEQIKSHLICTASTQKQCIIHLEHYF